MSKGLGLYTLVAVLAFFTCENVVARPMPLDTMMALAGVPHNDFDSMGMLTDLLQLSAGLDLAQDATAASSYQIRLDFTAGIPDPPASFTIKDGACAGIGSKSFTVTCGANNTLTLAKFNDTQCTPSAADGSETLSGTGAVSLTSLSDVTVTASCLAAANATTTYASISALSQAVTSTNSTDIMTTTLYEMFSGDDNATCNASKHALSVRIRNGICTQYTTGNSYKGICAAGRYYVLEYNTSDCSGSYETESLPANGTCVTQTGSTNTFRIRCYDDRPVAAAPAAEEEDDNKDMMMKLLMLVVALLIVLFLYNMFSKGGDKKSSSSGGDADDADDAEPEGDNADEADGTADADGEADAEPEASGDEE